MARLPILLLVVLATGCARPERTTSHADWMREATRVWHGETKARVIAAGEAVVRHSDPGDIAIEYSRQGFVARRKFFIYAVIATAAGEDRWSFQASENAEGASAAVRIVQSGSATAGRASERFRDNQTTIGSFRLFYARLDYLLGRRPDWIACSQAVAKLALPAEAPGLQALCSLTHQGADAPPPTKLPPKASADRNARQGPPDPPQIGSGDDAADSD